MDWEELHRSELVLWFDFDGHIGELFVEAAQHGFRGHASAWFSDKELVAFSRSLDGVVKRKLDQASLEGGPAAAQETWLSLRF